MGAPKGNQFWLLRSSHGRNPKFSKPDDLWNAACEYFQWMEDNPLLEEKGFAFQGVVTKEKFSKMRAMTIDGLCLFLDISDDCWRDYCKKKDFSVVTARILKVIRSQKFAGAAADLLNANIIARDLGLSDKSEFVGKDGGPIQTQTLPASEEELIEQAKRLGVDPVALGLGRSLQKKG